jgi:transcriptional regulator with XRE-family HTH domain
MSAISSAADPSVPAVPELPEIGPVLLAARQARGLSLAEAAGATNLRESFLESLERDDPLEAFPAPVYERFFLREYARFLGVQEEPLIEALEARMGTVEPTLEVPPPAVPPPRRWVGKLLVAAAAGGVIFLGLTSFRSNPAPNPVATGGPSAATTTAPPTSPKPSAAPVHYNGIQAALRFTGPCWVRASVDGKLLRGRTHSAHSSVSFLGHRTVELVLGNAGGVDLRINGKRVRTGGDGQVVTLFFAWRDGRVTSST